MKRLFVATAALVLAACASQETTAPDFGVANPNTPVNASFTVYVGGTVIYRESGPSNNGQGTCEAGGAYRNHGGQLAATVPHDQCATIVPGSEVTVTFAETANYVLATSGNVQLNFSLDPVTGEKRGVQYKKNSDWTTGFGVLVGSGDDGSTWTIDLSQISSSSNLLDDPPRALIVSACDDASPSTCSPTSLTW